MSFNMMSEQQSLIGGYVPVNFIDVDSLPSTDYEIRDGSHGEGETRIDGITILWLNNSYSASGYNEFMDRYFPNQYKYDDFPQNNIGSPTFRFKMGTEGKWFCISTKKYLTEGTFPIPVIKYKWGVSEFNFDSTKDYLVDTSASAENNGYMSDWWNTISTNQLYIGEEVVTQGGGFVLAKYQEKYYFGFTHFTPIDTPRFNWWSSALLSVDDLGLEIDDTFDEEYGEESKEGGYSVGGNPSFDDSSDSILIPNDPSISVSNLGFLNTYKVSTSGLSGMIEELFPEELLPIIPVPEGGGVLSDVAQSINALCSTVGNVFTSFVNSNLLQYVVDVHVVPVSPNVVGSEHIKVGFKTLDASALKVEHDYVNVSCGSLHIPEYYKNFLDYQSKCSLFVPFVGLVPVNPDMFLGGSISVDFKFNIIDGSFTAFVSCKSSKSKLNGVCGQYSGNCCVHIPITSNSYSNIVSGLVSAVGHGENMVTSKSLSSGSFASGIDAMANIESKPMYNMSNGFNATSSFMGVRIPYLIISRPVSSFSKAYPHEKGMPLNMTKKLTSLVGSGMTVCDKPHIDFECTEWERAEIERLLTSGVIL